MPPGMQAECVALTQQLSAAQAAAAGVEVEMDTITRWVPRGEQRRASHADTRDLRHPPAFASILLHGWTAGASDML